MGENLAKKLLTDVLHRLRIEAVTHEDGLNANRKLRGLQLDLVHYTWRLEDYFGQCPLEPTAEAALTEILDQLEGLLCIQNYSPSGVRGHPKLRHFTVSGKFDLSLTSGLEELVYLLQGYVDRFTRVISDTFVHIYTERLVRDRRQPLYEICSLARSAHRALAACSQCRCETEHDRLASLAVIGAPNLIIANGALELDLLLSFNDTDNHWQETLVLAMPLSRRTEGEQPTTSQGAQPRVIASTARAQRVESMMIRELCRPLGKASLGNTMQLRLRTENGRVFKTRSTRGSGLQFEKASSLASLLSIETRTYPLSPMVRQSLAVSLGHSVLYLDSWVESAWSDEDILFHEYNGSLPLRPYIRTKIMPLATPDSLENSGNNLEDSIDNFADPDDLPIHPYPGLVSLATILLGLERQMSLQDLLTFYQVDQRQRNVNTDWYNADLLFTKCKSQLSRSYHDAIEKCLSLDFGLNEEGGLLEEQELKEEVYDKIISRLEDELIHGFGEESIAKLHVNAPVMDLFTGLTAGSFLSFNMSPYAAKAARSSRNVPGPPIQMPIGHAELLTNESTNAPLNQNRFISEGSAEGKLFFDDEKPGQNSTPALSDSFIRNWKETYQSLFKDTHNGKRVRVAVLDSGVDFPPYVWQAYEDRIKDMRSWTPGNDCGPLRNGEDDVGHGTHVTALLLHLAPSIDLYIARIAKARPSHPEQIAKAIHYAVHSWEVDIISMSFGWPNQVEGYQKVEDAILDASRKGILMFAAASNDGGNKLRAFPARHDEVICVHSTDGRGNPSGFNPTPEKNHHNFSTLGENIDSVWPLKLTKQSDINAPTRKSGTSFATPVAVSIAAAMIELVRRELPDEAAKIKRNARMKAVLKLVAGQPRNGYHYLAPHFGSEDNFLGRGMEHIKLDVSLALRSS